jgi:hypothetical protein
LLLLLPQHLALELVLLHAASPLLVQLPLLREVVRDQVCDKLALLLLIFLGPERYILLQSEGCSVFWRVRLRRIAVGGFGWTRFNSTHFRAIRRILIHSLVVGEVGPSTLATETLRILLFDVARLDLLFNVLRERQNIESTVAPRTEHFLVSQVVAFEKPLEYFLSVNLTPRLELRHVQIDIHLHCQVSHCSFRNIWYGLFDQLPKLLPAQQLIFVKTHLSGRLSHELGRASL